MVKLVDKGSSWKNETHDLLLAFDENGEPNIIKVRYDEKHDVYKVIRQYLQDAKVMKNMIYTKSDI